MILQLYLVADTIRVEFSSRSESCLVRKVLWTNVYWDYLWLLSMILWSLQLNTCMNVQKWKAKKVKLITSILFIILLSGDIYHWEHQEIHQQSVCVEDPQRDTHFTQTTRCVLVRSTVRKHATFVLWGRVSYFSRVWRNITIFSTVSLPHAEQSLKVWKVLVGSQQLTTVNLSVIKKDHFCSIFSLQRYDEVT